MTALRLIIACCAALVPATVSATASAAPPAWCDFATPCDRAARACPSAGGCDRLRCSAGKQQWLHYTRQVKALRGVALDAASVVSRPIQIARAPMIPTATFGVVHGLTNMRIACSPSERQAWQMRHSDPAPLTVIMKPRIDERSQAAGERALAEAFKVTADRPRTWLDRVLTVRTARVSARVRRVAGEVTVRWNPNG